MGERSWKDEVWRRANHLMDGSHSEVPDEWSKLKQQSSTTIGQLESGKPRLPALFSNQKPLQVCETVGIKPFKWALSVRG